MSWGCVCVHVWVSCTPRNLGWHRRTHAHMHRSTCEKEKLSLSSSLPHTHNLVSHYFALGRSHPISLFSCPGCQKPRFCHVPPRPIQTQKVPFGVWMIYSSISSVYQHIHVSMTRSKQWHNTSCLKLCLCVSMLKGASGEQWHHHLNVWIPDAPETTKSVRNNHK